MLDLKYVINHVEEVRERLSTRGEVPGLDAVVRLAERRRDLVRHTQELQERRNRANQEMKEYASAGRRDRIEAVRGELKAISQEIKEGEATLRQVQEELEGLLLGIPNLPAPSVPVGTSAEDNPVVRVWGEPRALTFTPQPHWELGESLGILDFERAAKVTGARFTVYWGIGARLERALINFMLDLHTRQNGYTEVLPPFMVNRASMYGTGQLPKFEEDAFKVPYSENVEYFLVPTAEVPVTNLHREEILEGDQLPLRYVAYTPCFRSEAGAAGRDTRGLIRQHQFNKVELVSFTTPEQSDEEHQRLVGCAERVLQELGLHYRVVELCTGDLGANAASCYDLEVWIPSQECYREISSCSNFRDYQARRARIRFRRGPQEKPELVHTLNGSGLAIGRTVVAIMEQYQQEDGSIIVPEALRPYLGGVERISGR